MIRRSPRAALSRAARVARATRGGRLLGRARRKLSPLPPQLSVVVPFHDAVGTLQECVESLVAQTYRNVEVVLVDDGSEDGSAQVAAALAGRHRGVTVVRQHHQGVAAARNTGVEAAHGKLLAFCDADDVVPSDAYLRMATALASSGSDLAVGSATLQRQGRHQQPAWLRRSNPGRVLGTTLRQHPEILANLMPGTRLFRRAFWDRHGLGFAVGSDHSDIETMVRAMVLCDRFDVLPATVYQWQWRPDGRSLWQQEMVDGRRAADRVAHLRRAGSLVAEHAAEVVQASYFAEVLHTVVPDLVRASVTQGDTYWDPLVPEVAELLAVTPPAALRKVPVEDRIAVWLCGHDRRAALEQFLEYAFDNQTGLPHDEVDGTVAVRLPFLDDLGDVPVSLLAVGEHEMRYRTRLISLRWLDDQHLQLEGAAFVEYQSDDRGRSQVTLVVVDTASGQEWRVDTEPAPQLRVNTWAQRANEDHDGGGFSCVLDTAVLPRSPGQRAHYEVEVELVIAGVGRRAGFDTRQVSASPGLLEARRHDGRVVTPVWRVFSGLKLRVEESTIRERPRSGAPQVQVSSLSAANGVLTLGGRSTRPVELALVGPRSRSAWRPIARTGAQFEVQLSVWVDEWGVAPTTLPADRYQVMSRPASGSATDVVLDPSLWRSLPAPVVDGNLTFHPMAEDGRLSIRVVPTEWADSRPAYLRRRLRDVSYPASRSERLLEVVLFETFAGKAAGDNPGAVNGEMARRGLPVERVVSVTDRSVEVPHGARPVIRFSAEYFELLARARYLVVNASLPYFFRKREGQLYFQTWHGTPLKRIAHDRPHLDFFNWHHRRQLLVARDGWDYLLSQSEFCSRALSSAFRYSGPVLELGYPRNDVLVSPSAATVRAAVRRALGIADTTLVVLYAPTWRDNLRVGRVFDKVLYLDPHRLVAELGDAVVLVRGHYNSVQAAEDEDPERRVLDVTRYPDISDLYLAADALVTDYSSVYFDFVLTDKPILFLAPDLVQYRDDNRGFYLDYQTTVPGPICLSTDEVVDRLRQGDDHAEVRREFRGTYTPHDDGRASARTVDAILAWRGRQAD